MTTARVHVCPTCSRSFASGELHCPFDGSRLDLGERNDDPLIGQVIGGRYSVVSRLGAGGMGVVYRGLQAQLDRPVALKILNTSYGSDAQVEERFRTEARAASQLTNPHTVTVYDFGATDQGALFIAMQLIEGESLRARLGDGPLPLAAALAVASQVCESLAEAHSHRPQIIHRDIKPDNIMVRDTASGEPFVVVLDFGLARFSDGQRLTATNNVIGTPAYMSPEQARGGAEIDVRADLYALGIVLCEMLTGRPPFESTDPVQLLFKQAFDPPPALTELRPGLEVPAEVERIVAELLAKAPADRPPSAEVVRSRLLDLLQEIPADAGHATTESSPTIKRPSPWPMSPAPVTRRPTPKSVPAPTTASLLPAQEPSHGTAEIVLQAAQLNRRMRRRIGLLVLAAVVAVGAAIVFALLNHTDGSPPTVAPVPVAEANPPVAPPPAPAPIAPPPAAAPVVAAAPAPAPAAPPAAAVPAGEQSAADAKAAAAAPAEEKPKEKTPASLTQDDLDKLKL